MTPKYVSRVQPGEDVSVSASGTDRAWQIGMTLVEVVVEASSGGGARFELMDWPLTMAYHVWIVGGVYVW